MAQTDLSTPKYLVYILIEFLLNKMLCYDSDNGRKTYLTTCGDTQGCVLSTLLSIKYIYDGVLTL